jgi:hypothetical protein
MRLKKAAIKICETEKVGYQSNRKQEKTFWGKKGRDTQERL